MSQCSGFPNCGIHKNRISSIFVSINWVLSAHGWIQPFKPSFKTTVLLAKSLLGKSSCLVNCLQQIQKSSVFMGVSACFTSLFHRKSPGFHRNPQGFPLFFVAGHRLNDLFRKEMQTRGASIVKARKASSAMSTARAIVDHLKDLHLGTRLGALEVPTLGLNELCFRVDICIQFFPTCQVRVVWF